MALMLVSEEINTYSESFTSPESELLNELSRKTYMSTLSPQMLSGHLQGRALSLISKLVNPRRILEIGTFTGYSALCLTEGLAEGGLLHTIDVNNEFTDIAASYFERAGVQQKIIQHIGEGTEIIPTLQEKWDLVFIDADKSNYPNYWDLVADTVKPGGLIIADNVLWSGKVLKENQDSETKALCTYSKKVRDDKRFETVLLPLRDGLLIARKR